MPAAAKKAGTQANSVKKKPVLSKVDGPTGTVVDGLVDLPKPDLLAEAVKSPYPAGVKVFTYQPKGGGEPILLAMNGFETPNKLWHFDVAQLPVLSQTWKWMQQANIPKSIQRQAQMLPDAEYFAMFDAWFAEMKAAPRGALTAGK